MRRLQRFIGFDHRRCPFNTRTGALIGAVLGLLATIVARFAGWPAGLVAALLVFGVVAVADWRYHATR